MKCDVDMCHQLKLQSGLFETNKTCNSHVVLHMWKLTSQCNQERTVHLLNFSSLLLEPCLLNGNLGLGDRRQSESSLALEMCGVHRKAWSGMPRRKPSNDFWSKWFLLWNHLQKWMSCIGVLRCGILVVARLCTCQRMFLKMCRMLRKLKLRCRVSTVLPCLHLYIFSTPPCPTCTRLVVVEGLSAQRRSEVRPEEFIGCEGRSRRGRSSLFKYKYIYIWRTFEHIILIFQIVISKIIFINLSHVLI